MSQNLINTGSRNEQKDAMIHDDNIDRNLVRRHRAGRPGGSIAVVNLEHP